MLPVLNSAIKHLQELGPGLGASYPVADANMELFVLSSDAVQGDTWEAAVLAVPPDCSSWSQWMACPRRCLMTLSRHFRQLAIPVLSNAANSQNTVISAVASLQQKAARVLTWEAAATDFGIAHVTASDIWQHWEPHVTSTNGSDVYSPKSQLVELKPAAAQNSSAFTFRRCPLTFLQYMLSMMRVCSPLLAASGRMPYADVLYHTSEVRVHAAGETSPTIAGFHFRPRFAKWVRHVLLPCYMTTQAQRVGIDGYLSSFLPAPVSVSNGGLTIVYSACILGLQKPQPSMWSMGRMELLAMQVVFAMQEMLEAHKWDTSSEWWSSIENIAKAHRDRIVLAMVVAPHKMRMVNEEFESAAAGSSDRSDFILVAWKICHPHAHALAAAYHTTNVVPNTATMAPYQVYPESRILVRVHAPVGDAVRSAVATLAAQLATARGAPHAASFENPERMPGENVEVSSCADSASEASADYDE